MDDVIQHIKIEDIVPRNHRHTLNDIKALEELAISIKNNGIKEPLRLKKTNNRYEIISGNKRYKAAILAGLSKVPAIVEDSDSNYLLNYITGNNNKYPNSINNDSDVINLSELNKEYERDEFNMNNELMNNNTSVQQLTNNTTPATPTFGGRFFPSLEDEPTNMTFNTTIEPQPEMAQPVQPTNNFIDLTDTSNNIVSPAMPEQPQNIGPITEPVQQNLETQPENIMNNNIMPQNSGNVLNLENLTQNNSMVEPTLEIPQPVQPTNIDNNFQEIINDFQPASNMGQNINAIVPEQPVVEPQQLSEQTPMEPVISAMPNIDQVINNQINIPQDIIPTPVQEPIMAPISENIGIIQPEVQQPINIIPNLDTSIVQPQIQQEIIQPIQEPIAQPIQNVIEQPMPEVVVQVPQKDILPVINTLKAVGVNLENFGYTIRITDEDLPTSYKITIEVEK